jgi:hypothetical protein
MEHYTFEVIDVYCSNYFNERVLKDLNLLTETTRHTQNGKVTRDYQFSFRREDIYMNLWSCRTVTLTRTLMSTCLSDKSRRDHRCPSEDH